jgi:hypothetical protein
MCWRQADFWNIRGASARVCSLSCHDNKSNNANESFQYHDYSRTGRPPRICFFDVPHCETTVTTLQSHRTTLQHLAESSSQFSCSQKSIVLMPRALSSHFGDLQTLVLSAAIGAKAETGSRLFPCPTPVRSGALQAHRKDVEGVPRPI